MKYREYQKKERAKVVRDVQLAYKKSRLPNGTGALNKYMAKCQSCSASLRPGQGRLMFYMGSSYKILCHNCHEKEINTDVPKEKQKGLCAQTVNGFKIKKKFLSLCR